MPTVAPHDATDGPWNAAAVLHRGRVVGSYRKQALPNYGVFDEKRYFDPGPEGQALYRIGGVVVAVTVCEDVWVKGGPAVRAARRQAGVVNQAAGACWRELAAAPRGVTITNIAVGKQVVRQRGKHSGRPAEQGDSHGPR